MAASWGLARIGGGLSGIGGRSTAVGMPFRRVYVNLFRLFWEFSQLFRNLAETFQFGEFSRLRKFLGNRESRGLGGLRGGLREVSSYNVFL